MYRDTQILRSTLKTRSSSVMMKICQRKEKRKERETWDEEKSKVWLCHHSAALEIVMQVHHILDYISGPCSRCCQRLIVHYRSMDASDTNLVSTPTGQHLADGPMAYASRCRSFPKHPASTPPQMGNVVTKLFLISEEEMGGLMKLR